MVIRILQRQSSAPAASTSRAPQMEMSYATVELQPPWAGELLARNRKVARNIWSSSDLSELEILQIEKAVGVSPWTSASESPNNSREDSSNLSRNHGGHGGGEHNLRSIDPVVGVGGSSSRASSSSGGGGTALTPPAQQTDKPSMTSNNHATKGSKNKLLRGQRDSNSSSSSDFNNSISEYYDCKSSFEDAENNEESILEYGPGIVRKLRSKYQSLAVRQTSARPSLWRSASLENCLDLDQQPQEEHVRSPSPTPPPRQGKIYTKNMTVTQNVEPNETSNRSRGRTAATKAETVAKNNATHKSDRDRLRRARSVDALHNIVNHGTTDASRSSKRRNQQEIDEDILEKCKNVVMPKEEIIIIEMSKPSHISATGAALLRLTSSDKGKLQLFNGNNGYYYRNNSTAKNYFNANANGKVNSSSFDSSGLVRGESISSPEHELPPPDIVRETARLFEIHNNNSAGFNNWRKVVGQALRLTSNGNINDNSCEELSSTESRESTPAPSPVIVPTAVPLSPMSKPEKEITKGSSTNSSQVPPLNHSTPPAPTANRNAISGRQIGVIRPTVNGFKLEDNALSKSSPGLSPIIMNSSLSKGKPPLSPKPVNLFCTSSPKTLLSTNVNVNTTRASENNNANEKTETKPPKPGPRTLLNVNKNKPSEPFAYTSMQNTNEIAKASSGGLHQTNQNGNDVIPVSSPDKHVSTSLQNEESKSKSHFASVSLKPVPLVVSSAQSAAPARNLGGNKGSLINASSTLQEKEARKENQNTNNNASKFSSKPTTGNSVPSTMLTDSTTNGSSPSPTDEPLPFLQAKSKLKRQQNLNGNVRDEVLNTSNNNAPVMSNPLRTDKNANLETNNSQIKPKVAVKVKETEAESKKIGKTPAQEVAPPLPSSPIPSASIIVPRVKLTESLQTQPPPPPESKPRKTGRGSDNDGIMVFNFTKTRSKVPDYIEDDGTGRDMDDVDSSEIERIDPRLIHFVGANIIINGRSSIQKRPKSKKLSISFNEAATTTFEYPSETSILSEENDGSESNNNTSVGHNNATGILGQKTPNGIHGSVGGLGSYTPSKGSPSLYQLGTYKEKLVDAGDGKKSDAGPSAGEDYLKPDTETTTWSNEIGAADILF